MIFPLADYLGERLVVEIEESDRLAAAFNETTDAIDANLIKKWRGEIGQRPQLVDGEWRSIFRQKLGKGLSNSNGILLIAYYFAVSAF